MSRVQKRSFGQFYKKKIQERKFGQFYKNSIFGQFNGHTPPIKVGSRRPPGWMDIQVKNYRKCITVSLPTSIWNHWAWRQIQDVTQNSIQQSIQFFHKPGSHQRHKHKQRKQILLRDLRRQNNENFSLFRLLFCSLLMLGL